MKTITAGDTIKVRIEAKDDQSGIRIVGVEAVNLRDLPGSPNFEVSNMLEWTEGNVNAEVEVTIPEYIPDTKWKISAITIINGVGRTIKYSPGKDFEPILFAVKAKPGIDLTPAELISVKLVD